MSARILNRPGIGYFFGTAGIGIRYLETGHSVSVFRYFFKTGHSVSVFRYCISVSTLRKKPYMQKKKLKHL